MKFARVYRETSFDLSKLTFIQNVIKVALKCLWASTYEVFRCSWFEIHCAWFPYLGVL